MPNLFHAVRNAASAVSHRFTEAEAISPPAAAESDIPQPPSQTGTRHTRRPYPHQLQKSMNPFVKGHKMYGDAELLNQFNEYLQALNQEPSSEQRLQVLESMVRSYITERPADPKHRTRSVQKQTGKLLVDQFPRLDLTHQEQILRRYATELRRLCLAHNFNRDALQQGLQNFHDCLQLMKEKEGSENAVVRTFSAFIDSINTQQNYDYRYLSKGRARFFTGVSMGTLGGAGIGASVGLIFGTAPLTMGLSVLVGALALGSLGAAPGVIQRARISRLKHQNEKRGDKLTETSLGELGYTRSVWGRLDEETRRTFQKSFNDLLDGFTDTELQSPTCLLLLHKIGENDLSPNLWNKAQGVREQADLVAQWEGPMRDNGCNPTLIARFKKYFGTPDATDFYAQTITRELEEGNYSPACVKTATRRMEDFWHLVNKQVHSRLDRKSLLHSFVKNPFRGAVHLNLEKQNRLPPEIGQLENLVHLQAGPIENVPIAIGQCRQLRIVKIHDGQFTELPDEIGELRDLRTLDLSGGQLTGLPDSIRNLSKLRRLWLTRNRFERVPDVLLELNPATEINLAGNPFLGGEVERVRRELEARRQAGRPVPTLIFDQDGDIHDLRQAAATGMNVHALTKAFKRILDDLASSGNPPEK